MVPVARQVEQAVQQVRQNFLLKGQAVLGMKPGGHVRADHDLPVLKGQHICRGRVAGKAEMQAGTGWRRNKDERQAGGESAQLPRRQAVQRTANFSTEEPEVQPMTALPIAPMEDGFCVWHVGPEDNGFWGEGYFREPW